MLRPRETLRRALLQPQVFQIRAVGHRLPHEIGHAIRQRRGKCLFAEVERRLARQPHRRGEIRLCRSRLVLRPHLQQFRIRQVHLRKTHIQSGFQFAFRQRAHLVHYQLPRRGRLCRHLQHGPRAEHSKIGCARPQKNL